MAWQLVVETMDHAPPGLTVAERFVLTVIAEYVGRNPKLPKRECECSTTDIARRTGLAVSGVKDALRRLAGRGLDVRVPLSVGADGRPVYAFRGRVPRYRLPAFAAPLGCGCLMCQGMEGVASPTPSTVDTPSEGVGTASPFERKGSAQPPKGVAPALERSGSTHPPPVTGIPVAAAAESPAEEEIDPDAAAVAERLGISPADAILIVAAVEQKRKPENLSGYLRRIPDDDLRRMLPGSRKTSVRTRPALPDPCGQCDARPGDPPSARVVWTDDDRTSSKPCPRCHPRTVMSHAS